VLALYLGVRLVDAGLPQSDAVRFMRRLRRALEAEHAAILQRPPAEWLDHQSPFGLEREVTQGFLVREVGNMVFLVVQPDLCIGPIYARRQVGEPLRPANICHSPAEMTELIAHLSLQGGAILVIELVNITHRLAYWLGKTEPIKRGRK
jgi:hypothetical protein